MIGEAMITNLELKELSDEDSELSFCVRYVNGSLSGRHQHKMMIPTPYSCVSAVDLTAYALEYIEPMYTLKQPGAPPPFDRTNVAILLDYIKQSIHELTSQFVLEPNDGITHDALKWHVSDLLTELVKQRDLYDFRVLCDDTNNTDPYTLKVNVDIYPTRTTECLHICTCISGTDSQITDSKKELIDAYDRAMRGIK